MPQMYFIYLNSTFFCTYIMDELSLQEAYRFEGEQVVDQEGVGVFESTDDASINKGHISVYVCTVYNLCMYVCMYVSNYLYGEEVVSRFNDLC